MTHLNVEIFFQTSTTNMNHRIHSEKRAMILTAICEGLALNSACRMFKASKPNVLRLLREVGEEDTRTEKTDNLTFRRLIRDFRLIVTREGTNTLAQLFGKQACSRGFEDLFRIPGHPAQNRAHNSTFDARLLIKTRNVN